MPLLDPATKAIFGVLAGACAVIGQDAGQVYRQGMQLLAAHKPAEAIAALERSVALKPQYAPAWKALGVVYAEQGDYEHAEEPFHQACERQPALPDACLYFGRTLYLLNRFQPALYVLRNALQNDKNNPEIYRLIGLSAEALGEPAEAGAAFQSAVRLAKTIQAGMPVLHPNEDPGIDYGVYL